MQHSAKPEQPELLGFFESDYFSRTNGATQAVHDPQQLAGKVMKELQ